MALDETMGFLRLLPRDKDLLREGGEASEDDDDEIEESSAIVVWIVVSRKLYCLLYNDNDTVWLLDGLWLLRGSQRIEKKRRDRCRRHRRFVILLSLEYVDVFGTIRSYLPDDACAFALSPLYLTIIIPISVGERQTRDRNCFGRSQFEFRFAPIFTIGRRGNFQERN